VKARLIPIQYESTLDRRDGVSYVSDQAFAGCPVPVRVPTAGDNSLARLQRSCPTARSRAQGRSRPEESSRATSRSRRMGGRWIVANQDSGHIRVFAAGRSETGAAGDDRGNLLDPGAQLHPVRDRLE